MRETLFVQAASLAGVGLLVGLAWAFGFRRGAKIESEDAVRALATAEGEALDRIVLDTRGRAALARTAAGALFAAKVVGGDVAVRVAPAGDVRVRRRGGALRVSFPGLAWDDVTLTLDAAAQTDWIDAFNAES